MAHAVFAGGYAFDGVMRLVHARRIHRASRRNRPLMTSSHRWVLWANFGAYATLTGVGALIMALPGNDADRGVGVSFVAHGSWLVSLAISHLVKTRRGRITWMARQLGALQF